MTYNNTKTSPQQKGLLDLMKVYLEQLTKQLTESQLSTLIRLLETGDLQDLLRLLDLDRFSTLACLLKTGDLDIPTCRCVHRHEHNSY